MVLRMQKDLNFNLIFYILAYNKQLDRQIFTWSSHLVSLLFNEMFEKKMAEKLSNIFGAKRRDNAWIRIVANISFS